MPARGRGASPPPDDSELSIDLVPPGPERPPGTGAGAAPTPLPPGAGAPPAAPPRRRVRVALGLVLAVVALVGGLRAVGDVAVRPHVERADPAPSGPAPTRPADPLLPPVVEGRARIAGTLIGPGWSGGLSRAATLTAVPGSLDLAVGVGCGGTRGVVEVRLSVQGRFLDDVVCVGAGYAQLTASGPSYEGYWRDVRAGGPMTVSAEAVGDVPSGVHLALGVYAAPPVPSALPAEAPAVPRGLPAGARLLGTLDLGAARRVATVDTSPWSGGPLLVAVACAGPADRYGYRVDVAGPAARLTGSCADGGRSARLAPGAVPAAGGRPGRPLPLTAVMVSTGPGTLPVTAPVPARAAVRVWLYAGGS